MKIQNIHQWNVSTKEAPLLQKQLAAKVRLTGDNKRPKIVAGADISLNRNSNIGYAGVVLLEFPSLAVIQTFTLVDTITFPYVPGLLSFREGPILLELFRKVRPPPDLVFFDGHGYAHPRRLGLACHMGLFLDCPTIGCAKSKLIGNYAEPGKEKGDTSPLLDHSGETLGAVVRSRENCKPIFVSAGHKIGLETAVQRTLESTTRYRIPEPTRQAHILVNELRKSYTDPR
jgi:deoxyribonuclease V